MPVADHRRPLDDSPRSGISYRDGHGFRSTIDHDGRQQVGAGPGPGPAPLPLPAIWNGAYAGLHAGYGRGRTEFIDTTLGSLRTDGGIAGAHLGYNWHSGLIVAGVEADLGAHWLNGHRSFASGRSASAETDWSSSLRARLGYAAANSLIYLTGGVAIASQHFTLAGPGAAVGRAEEMLVGYVAGGGVEWKLMPQMSLRGEVLHYGFRETNTAPAGVAISVRNDATVVRAGVSFHLN
jgi:opacity protein-like surface antigen